MHCKEDELQKKKRIRGAQNKRIIALVPQLPQNFTETLANIWLSLKGEALVFIPKSAMKKQFIQILKYKSKVKLQLHTAHHLIILAIFGRDHVTLGNQWEMNKTDPHVNSLFTKHSSRKWIYFKLARKPFYSSFFETKTLSRLTL